jgi:CubicO group peptidase (beta-lactamase class C family)
MSYKMFLNCLKFSSVAFLLLIFQEVNAQPKNKNQKEYGVAGYQDLDDVIARSQKQLGGNLVAMVWRDTLVYKRELGEFDSRTQAPIGSASKWLTIALVMQFVEDGKISLDDKINQYIPMFSKYGKNYITIRHCLTHFTGIQASGSGLFGKKKFGSLEDEVNEYAKHEIQTNPGTEFRYTDMGINIAARIVEVVSKKKFDMVIRQRLLNPLGMRQTTFTTLDASAADPASGAMSSANDLIKFLQMLLNNGTYNGQKILTEASVKELRKIETSSEKVNNAPKSAEGLSYAIGGWAVDENGTEATALSSPGLYGTWPVVDWCRGYAYLLITKSSLGEQKKDVYQQMKVALDDKISSKCK